MIAAALGSGVVSVGGVKIIDAISRRGAGVAQTALRGRTEVAKKRVIADMKLSGDAQKDIAAVHSWMLDELRAAQARDDEREAQILAQSGKIASLETANNALNETLQKIKLERDTILTENQDFIKRITQLLEQATILQQTLAAKQIELAMISIELEGAKERIEKQQATIREMTAFIHESQQRQAELEAEAERLRVALRAR